MLGIDNQSKFRAWNVVIFICFLSASSNTINKQKFRRLKQFQCKLEDYDQITSNEPINKTIMSKINEAAIRVSMNAHNCNEFNNLSLAALEKIFQELHINIFSSKDLADSGNGWVGSVRNASHVFSTDFFASLQLLITKALRITKAKCLQKGGVFDHQSGKCIVNENGQAATTGTNELFFVKIIGNSSSIVGLAVLLVILYVFKDLRTVPGRYVIHLAVVLTIGHSLLLLSLHVQQQQHLCTITGVLIHWIYLTVFSLMGIIALSTARTFCQPLSVCLDERLRRYRLAMRASYGFPVVVIIPCIIIQFVSSEKVSYGDGGSCFITNNWASIITFEAPVGCILLFNIGCLVIAVSKIHNAKSRNMKILRRGNRHELRIQTVLLVLKLGTFCGVGWVFGFIYAITSHPIFKWLFQVLSSFQGLCIFIGFVCSARIFSFCKKKLAYRKKTVKICSSDLQFELKNRRKSRPSVDERSIETPV